MPYYVSFRQKTACDVLQRFFKKEGQMTRHMEKLQKDHPSVVILGSGYCKKIPRKGTTLSLVADKSRVLRGTKKKTILGKGKRTRVNVPTPGKKFKFGSKFKKLKLKSRA